MKLYVHNGPGQYIGSCVIVWAGSKKTAKKLVREELDRIGLEREHVDIIEEKLPKRRPSIVHSDNGDY